MAATRTDTILRHVLARVEEKRAQIDTAEALHHLEILVIMDRRGRPSRVLLRVEDSYNVPTD